MPTKQSNIVEALKLLAVMPAAGAGIGGLIGAARAPKGKRLRTALGDAGVGGLAGLGFALGGTAGGAAGATIGGNTYPGEGTAGGAGLGAGLGAVGAGMLGQKIREEMDEEYDQRTDILNQFAGKTGSAITSANMKKQADGPSPVFGSETLGFLRSYPNTLKYWMPQSTIAGSLIGAGAGAATGSGALRGALRGGMIGAGAGAGVPLGAGVGMGLTADAGLYGDGISSISDNVAVGVPTMLTGSAAGGVAGGMAGNSLYNVLERAYDNRNSKKDKKPMKKKTEKQSAARSFGQKVAAGYDFSKLLPAAGGGAALGALGGGLAGFINPGEDGEGRRRSRFGSALRGALGGGALGGAAGAGIEAYKPGTASEVQKYLAGFMPNKRDKPVATPPALKYEPRYDPRPIDQMSDEDFMNWANNSLGGQ